jgi:phosphoglycolate phosphatase-like HAD superfamily hydrolase
MKRQAALTIKPLILFDLVSTLTQAGPRYAQAYIRMCQAWGMTPPRTDDILAALGEKNLKQIIAAFTPDLPAEHIGKFMSDCNQACDALLADKSWEEHLYPRVVETLQSLRDGGHTLGVFTGTRESAMMAQLRYHGIEGLFDPAFLRGKDNVRDGMKRNDELKAGQITALGTRYDGPVLVVGDSMADYAAAQAAGAHFIAFAATPARARIMQDAGIAVFTDYAQLPALIAQAARPAPTPGTPQRAPGAHR